VVADSRVDLARSYVGIAVKAGADHPDIATETNAARDAARRASGLFADRASGIFFAQLIERMGLHPRSTPRPDRSSGFTANGSSPARLTSRGKQISELKQVEVLKSSGRSRLRAKSCRVFRRASGGLKRAVQADELPEISRIAQGAPVL